MSQPNLMPLPRAYRVRADVTALIGGAVVFFVSGFLFDPHSHAPSSLVILAVIALITTICAAIAASDNFADAIDHQELVWRVRCGTRAAGFGSFVAAGMTVLAARMFSSQGAAISAFIPAALSILPSAFCGILAGAVAAGIRVPAAPPRESSRDENRGGFTAIVVLLSTSAFSAALVPQSVSTAPASSVTTNVSSGYASPTVPQSRTAPIRIAPVEANNGTPAMNRPATIQSPVPMPLATPYAESSATTSFNAATPSLFNTPPPTYPRSIDANDPAYAPIYTFVMNHHEKINRGDLRGLMYDYADQVVYFLNGVVNRDRIFQEEHASRAKYRRYFEQVMQPIVITEMSAGHYHVQYQIVYDGQKRSNQPMTGVAPVHLFVKDFGNGLQIVSQQNQLESGD